MKFKYEERKQKNGYLQVPFSCDKDLYKLICDEAISNERTLSSQIRFILKKHYGVD